jgi:hypothetical protein
MLNTVEANEIKSFLADQKYQNIMISFEGTGSVTQECEKMYILCAVLIF